MKNLEVPYLPALDVLDLSSVGFLLENKSQRAYLDVINWVEYSYKPIVALDIARSDVSLYLRYFVKGNSLRAVYDKDNSPVHKDSCVEFFMKRMEDETYMNFEFNCIGTCDAARRISRESKTSLTEEEYASIRRYSNLERKPFHEKKGVYEWELVVAIPLRLMGLDPQNMPEKVMGNFYKCADETDAPHYISWNPVPVPTPDFHRPECFGEIYFEPVE
ncbi:MAG: hypothetical protein LBQ65_01655 [Tannerellaceae bacterium]|jgi:hypothetical protein|nr:hypothetical protein [Tannerellaceae bacterium]